MSEVLGIDAILQRAGGVPRIAAASQGKVTLAAVYKWRKIGVPDRHWPLVMGLSGASADEMLQANIAVRSSAKGAGKS